MTMTGEPTRYRWQRDSRYYEALLQQDLFGWVVVRVWGGIGTRLGQVRTTPVNSYAEGTREVDKIIHQRAVRHYQLVHCSSRDSF